MAWDLLMRPLFVANGFSKSEVIFSTERIFRKQIVKNLKSALNLYRVVYFVISFFFVNNIKQQKNYKE